MLREKEDRRVDVQLLIDTIHRAMGERRGPLCCGWSGTDLKLFSVLNGLVRCRTLDVRRCTCV